MWLKVFLNLSYSTEGQAVLLELPGNSSHISKNQLGCPRTNNGHLESGC